MSDETNGSGAGERAWSPRWVQNMASEGRSTWAERKYASPCNSCGAAVGEPCRTASGFVTTRHTSRRATPDADDASEHELLAHAKCRCGAEHDARGTGESGEAWYARHILDPEVASTGASEGLSEAECASLSEAVGRSVRPNGYVAVAVERIIAARESAAATRARAEERERIAQAIEALPCDLDHATRRAARIARGDA